MSFFRELVRKSRRRNSNSHLAAQITRGYFARKEVLNAGKRRLLRHESLEGRLLLASVDFADEDYFREMVTQEIEVSGKQSNQLPAWVARPTEISQPHFVGSQTILSASANSALGDIPWDSVQSELHNRRVADRVKDNPNFRVDEQGNVMAINRLTIPLPDPNDKKDDKDSDSGNNGPVRLDPFPPSQTFLLHSLPGATKTIYLDFNGHTTTGTLWNSQVTGGAPINTSAFNFEGSSASFTDNELFRIQRIWERVAEDFLPFNVNVTTEEPPLSSLIRSGGSDTQWGVRVVIGPDNWFGGAGGVAFLNSFNWNSDTPCFVFSNALSNIEKDIAEATSHEVGHTLGLNHDGQGSNEYYTGHGGSGATSWAPIMGVGYSRQLVQWSRGEYTGATNTEDDLQLITTLNGFSYRTDDHGNNTGSATPLPVIGSTANSVGIIERNTDIDFFSFNTSGGNVSITLTPFYRGPNLDILAKLYNSSGTEIASNNPTAALNASFSTNLSAGSYFLSIQGTGKAAAGSDLGYSNYGSLGFYSIAATIPQQPATLLATLSGGNLNVTDSAGAVNNLTLSVISGNLTITDANEKFASAPSGGTLSNGDKTLTIPGSLITGTVTINAGNGNDTVVLGIWSGSTAPSLTIFGEAGTDSTTISSEFSVGNNRSLQIATENLDVSSGSQVTTLATGSITFTVDDLTIGSSAAIVSTGGSVVVRPQSAGREINLGTKIAGHLALSAAELNRLSGSELHIGNASSGRITVSASISLDGSSIELRSGADIVLTNGTISSAGSLLLAPGASPFGIKPKASGTDASLSSLALANNLVLEINGTNPDTGYDRLSVTGTVNLNGVNLAIAGSFPAITGNETFTIVSATSVIGNFNSLPNGASILVHGKSFVISYSSNSVQLVPAQTFSTINQAYVYHVNSSFAGGGITPALDTQKSLAKEGPNAQTLTLDNLINSSRGINGIVFDFNGLPVTSLSASDFEFRVSPQSSFNEGDHPTGSWQLSSVSPTISVLPGAVDRVVLQWPDNAIRDRWLRIKVLANANTGLENPETYYIGHLLGETTGSTDGVFSVSFADISLIRAAVGQTVDAGSLYDIDKNGSVTFSDISAMRGNIGAQLTRITIPPSGSGIPLGAPGNSGLNDGTGPTQNNSGYLTLFRDSVIDTGVDIGQRLGNLRSSTALSVESRPVNHEANDRLGLLHFPSVIVVGQNSLRWDNQQFGTPTTMSKIGDLIGISRKNGLELDAVISEKGQFINAVDLFFEQF